MYFNKIHHPANFAFAASADPAARTLRVGEGDLPLTLDALGGDVFRLRAASARWQPHASQAELTPHIHGPDTPGPDTHALALTPGAALHVTEAATGRTVLAGAPGATFGVCGAAWLLQFRHEPGMQFYGLGEHSKRLEKSGQRVKFWNTDVFGDFAPCEIRDGYVNPMYVAVPWLIVKQGNHFLGLLVNNPGAVFMDLASNFVWNARNREDVERRSFYIGAPEGAPEVYVLVGPSLAELTRKLQHLVGRTPLPPLWALGHHQCRWGYGGAKDLERLDRRYRAHAIPCDGLWLDIDYMERYQVFTFSRKHWQGEDHVREVLAALAKRGRRVVPILDPGVKVGRGYAVCDDGLRADVFCRNAEGLPYVGFVWPGKTYFPDFSLPEGRAWWAGYVKNFAETGVAGAWIDMNDPSTGAVELDDLRFGRGTQPHASYHNQYALGMAQATRAGFLAARPDERPFLLSRSAFISSSRFTAVWTGDNVSNWHHLRMAIPLSLGLALSGIPFNGPDVGGFMEDTTPALAVAWYKAGFLFPFLRNHSSAGTRLQEPWELGPTACATIAHYVRLRYKLLPYLYQLFVRQAETGEAILRPLFHDFADTSALPLGEIEDQFLVGPAILQAPLVVEGALKRDLVLPGKTRWFSAQDGRWAEGGRVLPARAGARETPLFLREGALVPMQAGERTDNANDLAAIELHCFLRRDTKGVHTLRYVCDDGLTFGHERGERTAVVFEARVARDGALQLTTRLVQERYRPLRVRVVVYDRFAAVRWHEQDRADAPDPARPARALALGVHRWRFTGRTLLARATGWIDVHVRPGRAPRADRTPSVSADLAAPRPESSAALVP